MGLQAQALPANPGGAMCVLLCGPGVLLAPAMMVMPAAMMNAQFMGATDPQGWNSQMQQEFSSYSWDNTDFVSQEQQPEPGVEMDPRPPAATTSGIDSEVQVDPGATERCPTSSGASTTASEREAPRNTSTSGPKKSQKRKKASARKPAPTLTMEKVRDQLRANPNEVITYCLHKEPVGGKTVQAILDPTESDKTLQKNIVDALYRCLAGNLELFLKICRDMNGNFVVTKLIKVAPFSEISWLNENLQSTLTQISQDAPSKTMWERLACHERGCRIIQRMLEFHGKEKEVQQVIRRAIELHTGNIYNKEFARYVLERAWETAEKYGVPAIRETILRVTTQNVLETATDKHASFMLKFLVSQKVPLFDEQCNSIVDQVTVSAEVAKYLAMDKYAHHLIAEILGNELAYPRQHKRLVSFLRQHARKLEKKDYKEKTGGNDMTKETTNKVYMALLPFVSKGSGASRRGKVSSSGTR